MTTPRRAAHRPSRRDTVIESALELFAAQPPGSVTVTDIARRAGMTPAAVYYHFPSKDHVLQEGVRASGVALHATVAAALPALGSDTGLDPLVTAVLGWLDEHEAGAVVFFVASVGVSQDVEAIRLQTRTGLLELLARAARQVRGPIAEPEAAVVAAGLLTVLETAATSGLERDATYRALGRRDFRREVVALADRVVGP
jgi:AcrR family transcriptional regulator